VYTFFVRSTVLGGIRRGQILTYTKPCIVPWKHTDERVISPGILNFSKHEVELPISGSGWFTSIP